MKKKMPRIESFFTQFSYDHRKFGNQAGKIRKSAAELSRILNSMSSQKEGQKEKEEKNKKFKKSS